MVLEVWWREGGKGCVGETKGSLTEREGGKCGRGWKTGYCRQQIERAVAKRERQESGSERGCLGSEGRARGADRERACN